jgi:hypothetical protein
MAQNYTYDPSQQISKSFEKTSANIGNIFTGIIEQKQRDYKLAENSFQNIEALKKNLNVFGQREITNESNQLLKEASTAIYENGKLDYNKLGEIRQKISEISDLKQGYEIGAKAFEQGIAMGNANKDNLISYTKYYNDMLSKMSDKNLVKNPQDLQKAFQKTYTDNLNLDKIFQSTLTSIQPLESVTKEVTNKKGDKIQISAKLPVGWSVDDSGKTIIPQGQAKATLDWLKQNNPDFLAQMKEKAGVGGDIAGEEGVVQYYLENMPVDRGMKTVATAEQLRAQELELKGKEFETSPEMLKLKKDTAKANLNYLNRRGFGRGLDGQDVSETSMPEDNPYYEASVPLEGKGKRSVKLTGVGLGKEVKVAFNNNQRATITDVARSQATGDLWAKVLVDKDNNYVLLQPGQTQTAGQEYAWRKVKEPETFKKQLFQTIDKGLYANKIKPIVKGELGNVFNAPNKGIKRGAVAPAVVSDIKARPTNLKVGILD